jgi:flagellar FliJ protein
MSSLQPLLILLDQHERKRDAAIAAHHRALAASQAAAHQASELLSYRQQYEQRWHTQFASGGQIQLVNCYQGFTERLSMAVEQQNTIADLAKRQVDAALGALQEIEMRCASVRKLIERRELEQRLVADRRDQKQTDEFAARVAWSRANSDQTGPA